MLSTIEEIENLAAELTELAETKIELLKLKAADKISLSLSGFVAIVAAVIFGGAALSIISFGFAFLIGSKLNNDSLGFFIVGGIYALAGLLIFVNRKKWVQVPLSNFFIDKLIK